MSFVGTRPEVTKYVKKYTKAGFNHIVFIVRKDIESEFKEVIGKRITSICKEDVVAVRESFEEMLEKGIYREVLFSDL